jgi:hypothetical protein
MNIDRIISIIRSLKEEGVVAAPTMNLGSGNIAGTVEAGDDPPVFKGKKKNIYLGAGSRKNWMQKRNKPS